MPRASGEQARSRALRGAERAQKKQLAKAEQLGRKTSLKRIARRISVTAVEERRDSAATAEVGRLATLFLASAGMNLELMEEVSALAPKLRDEDQEGGGRVWRFGGAAPGEFAKREAEEDRRWASVEEGTGEMPWRSCAICGFLNWGDAERCESCAMRLPRWSSSAGGDSDPDDAAADATDELRIMCIRSEPVNPTRAWRWLQDLEKKVSRASRWQLEEMLFEGLDRNGAGVLGCNAMLRFARICGWDGEDHAWEVEYASLCEMFSIDMDHGIDLEKFSKMLRTTTFKGYCTDDELCEILLEDHAKMLRFARKNDIDWDMTPLPGSIRRLTSRMRSQRSQQQRQQPTASSSSSSAAAAELPAAARRLSWRQEAEMRGRRSISELVEDDDDDDSEQEGSEQDASGDEASSFEGSTSEESEDEMQAIQANSLDESPPVGTLIEVYCDDGLWYVARIVACRGTRGSVMYLDDDAEDEVDFSTELARLAEAPEQSAAGLPKSAKRRSRGSSCFEDGADFSEDKADGCPPSAGQSSTAAPTPDRGGLSGDSDNEVSEVVYLEKKSPSGGRHLRIDPMPMAQTMSCGA